jgi:hypothetical protein
MVKKFKKKLTSTNEDGSINSVVTSVDIRYSSLKTKQNLNVNVLFLSLYKTTIEQDKHYFIGEFDPGSGRTLAACLIHASRANLWELAPVN